MKRSGYPVYERFFTWQGEGTHLGRSAFFIRLFGCPVHCPWCDSAGTWHPDLIPDTVDRFSADELAEEALEHHPDLVVITGGEPCIHDLTALSEAIHQRGLKVHLETSGAFPIKGDIDWITLSPKVWKKPLPENVARADEIKIIVDRPDSIEYWEKEIGEHWTTDDVWLNPEWSHSRDSRILHAINEAVKQHGMPYRAGYQLHKLYHVDEEDPHTRPITPLPIQAFPEEKSDDPDLSL